MTDRVLRLLEYNTILKLLSEMAVCPGAADAALKLCPQTGIDAAARLQKETSEAVSMIIRNGNPPISPVSDITGAVRRAGMGGVLSMAELLGVCSALRVSRKLAKYVLDLPGYEILSGIASRITDLRELENDISSAILSDEQIADDASAKLFDIRRRIKAVNNRIKDILSDMIHSQSVQKYLQEPIVTLRGDRYVVPVKSEHKADVPGILHDSSATGATLFIEPIAVVQANNQLRALEAEERNEVERILAEFSARVAEYSGEIIENYNALISLDYAFAKAKLSLKYNGAEPELNECGRLKIIKGRHPLIEPSRVVPIDVNLGFEFDTLVITGPNTGGKTVTLKTIGLLTLMAQSGLHVPAACGTELCVFEDVFADIGDEQSIEQSLSTFSSHMVNIVEILSSLDGRSLVLFDELGAGTDPDEGAALAVSILEYCRSKGAKTVATTHYSELKLYALTTGRVENASCEFDVETLRPTYRLLLGIPGKSNAFAISERLGLDSGIIEDAKARLASDRVRFEDIVAELENKRVGAAQAYDEAARLKAEAARLKAEAQALKDSLEAKRQKLLNEARAEARQIVQQAKDDISAIIKEAQRLALDASRKEHMQDIERLRTELREKAESIDHALAAGTRGDAGAAPKKLMLGNTVDIATLGERGTVATLPDSKGDLFVQVGIMKVKVNIRDLRAVEGEKARNAADKVLKARNGALTYGTAGKSMAVSAELDVRGQTTDQAVLNVEKFIDDAVLSSLSQVSIIHGKGTGALRAAIHEFLKTSKFVKGFRLGKYGEGDSGVTIVELK